MQQGAQGYQVFVAACARPQTLAMSSETYCQQWHLCKQWASELQALHRQTASTHKRTKNRHEPWCTLLATTIHTLVSFSQEAIINHTHQTIIRMSLKIEVSSGPTTASNSHSRSHHTLPAFFARPQKATLT